MEDVFKEFGQGFLAIISVIGVMLIIYFLWQPGNVVPTAIINFMTSICG